MIQQGYLVGTPQEWQVFYALFWLGVTCSFIGLAALLIAERWSDAVLMSAIKRHKRAVITAVLVVLILVGIQGALLAFPSSGGCSVTDPPYWYRCFVCGECWP